MLEPRNKQPSGPSYWGKELLSLSLFSMSPTMTSEKIGAPSDAVNTQVLSQRLAYTSSSYPGYELFLIICRQIRHFIWPNDDPGASLRKTCPISYSGRLPMHRIGLPDTMYSKSLPVSTPLARGCELSIRSKAVALY